MYSLKEKRPKNFPSPAIKTHDTNALQVSDQVTTELRAEIVSITRQRDEAETARASVAAALEEHKTAAAARESELGEEMLKARRVAEKMMNAGDDDVIAVEKMLRAKHEKEVSDLRDRACTAEKQVIRRAEKGTHKSCSKSEWGSICVFIDNRQPWVLVSFDMTYAVVPAVKVYPRYVSAQI